MKLDPGDGAASAACATLLSEVGQVDDAVRVLREATSESRTTRTTSWCLGGILTKIGRNDEAIKVFEDMLKRFGDNDEVVKLVRPQPFGHLRQPGKLRQG